MAKITYTIPDLTNGVTYYGKVFSVNPKKRVNNRADLTVFAAIPSDLPAEPSEYLLIGTYTSAQTWIAPEDGWFMVEAFGASGNGGNAYYYSEDDGEDTYYYTSAGGGGGGGGYAASAVKLKKGDTIVITSLAVGSVATIYFNSSIETYSNILVTSGGNGRNGAMSSGGAGGSGGSASGGNISNVNGNSGGRGTYNSAETSPSYVFNTTTPGSGGTSGYLGGRTGGKGGYNSGTFGDTTKPTNGSAGYTRISRGNTNVIE